jgi:hypothetical protein
MSANEKDEIRHGIIMIPEADFSQDLKSSLNELSEEIAMTGLSISAIARGTRCHWTTVGNAANGIPVRFDSYRRLMVFLNKLREDNNSKILVSDE